MKKIGVIAVLWVGCAVFNFGGINAQLCYDDQVTYASLNISQRHEIGMTVLESCLLPPIQVVSMLIITNFLEHGWFLGRWPSH